MARTQTLVQLSEELLEVLDRAASRRATSRSAIIREAVEEYLARERALLIDERVIAGYRAVPPGRPDEWGALDELGDHATLEVLVKLEHEERRDGVDGW